MNKYQMDRPVTRQFKTNNIKETPNFADIVQVNEILEKRSMKNRNKSINNPSDNEHFITLASLKNKNVKYQNQKQEQFHRLDRKPKIKENEEWSELLKNPKQVKSSSQIIPKNCFQQIKETNRQIDEASAELNEINLIIDRRKTLKSNIINSSITKANSSMSNKAKLAASIQKRHACTKGVYPEKVKDVNTIMTYLEKQSDIDNSNIKPEKVKKPTQKRLNTLRTKQVDKTLSLVNEKLNKVTEKYFTSDYETTIKSVINKKPKYRSVKNLMTQGDMQKVEEIPMEASKIMQNELEKDLTKLEIKNPGYVQQQNKQMQVLYENLDFLENQVFNDNFSDEDKKEIKTNEVTKKIHSANSQDSEESLNDADRRRMQVPSKMYSGFKTSKNCPKRIENKAIGVPKETMTNTEVVKDDLRTAILKSDYLRKEFGMLSDPYIPGSSYNPADIQTNLKNNSWSRDIEYLMK